jgi:hypothetical protein
MAWVPFELWAHPRFGFASAVPFLVLPNPVLRRFLFFTQVLIGIFPLPLVTPGVVAPQFSPAAGVLDFRSKVPQVFGSAHR